MEAVAAGLHTKSHRLPQPLHTHNELWASHLCVYFLFILAKYDFHLVLLSTGFKSIPWNSKDFPSKISSKTPTS